MHTILPLVPISPSTRASHLHTTLHTHTHTTRCTLYTTHYTLHTTHAPTLHSPLFSRVLRSDRCGQGRDGSRDASWGVGEAERVVVSRRSVAALRRWGRGRGVFLVEAKGGRQQCVAQVLMRRERVKERVGMVGRGKRRERLNALLFRSFSPHILLPPCIQPLPRPPFHSGGTAVDMET
jgi:hypothetical protein